MTRILTGMVLLILALVWLFVLPPAAYAGGVMVLMLLSSLEGARLKPGVSAWASYASVIWALLLMLALAPSYLLFSGRFIHYPNWLLWYEIGLFFVLVLSVCFWLWVSTVLWRYPHVRMSWQHRVGFLNFCWLLPFGVSLMVYLAKENRVILFLAMLPVWLTDIGAYYSGSWWGRHKLLQSVSPNKTWEGVLGGFILALLGGSLAAFLLWPYPKQPTFWRHWPFIILMTVIASIIGDLFESLRKRVSEVKDSGNYLPGHGGVLDRIDSLIAALPIYTTFMLLTLLPHHALGQM